ncbi:MAG: nucleotidyltransferase domain-containing protein [Candidatus Pacebacteria bacterium]|nr:nucleotidyltransferase domain-containing protein [Candidatus Paceibacterota bacterium]NUQ57057.1 nucleotidyltransferase domain-containing protein [Candidatus Paceibacter sp.]
MFNQQDQILIDNFVRELSDNVGRKFNDDIDFIILYGSAARGEFVKGASDIDLLIQTKSDGNVEEIKNYATEIFWKLDEKYGTEFQKVCAKEAKTGVEKVFKSIESKTPLFAPLFVYGPNDLDWVNGKVLKKGVALGANLFASQYSVFLNFKRDGKVYWGRDITREIKVQGTGWEKLKGILIPQYFSIVSLIMWPFPVLWKKGVKYAIKAVLYDVDAVLIYLDRIEKSKLEDKIKIFKDETYSEKLGVFLKEYVRMVSRFKKDLLPKQAGIINESLGYKINGFKGGRLKALFYILRVIKFVHVSNLIAVFSLK